MFANLNLFVGPKDSLRKAMEAIDKNSLQICFVVDAEKKLLGALTDGDIRRALLKSAALDESVELHMNASPKFLLDKVTRLEILEKMRSWQVRHIPILDNDGKILRIETSNELMGLVKRRNRVVLMAGGYGKRLSPLTDAIPKPLLEIGGRPILETIIRSFREHGFFNFTLVVNYRSEMLKNYFGNGDKLGVVIDYLHEDQPLGTCGGLSLLPLAPDDPFFVMNGDILTKADFGAMLEDHISNGALATMAVREHIIEVPYGVVKVVGERIVSIEEKPKERFFVNAGIYVLSPEALNLIPKNQYFDMPSLFMKLHEQSALSFSYKLNEYWIDIGRMEDFHRAQSEYNGHFRILG